MSLRPYYETKSGDFILYKGDCNRVLPKIETKVDLIFADPPYFLSSGGNTIHSGEIVSVNKGEWDKSKSLKQMLTFNKRWLTKSRQILDNNGTIWISGTKHNIFSIIQSIELLNYKLLNVIVWEKTNPPPNFYTKIFKHSTEYIVFARKSEKHTHTFNSDLLKQINNGKRFSEVWRMPSIEKWEKSYGKHKTQKPINILARLILASTNEGDVVLDPFSGSASTGIAANLLGRKYIGIEKEKDFLDLSIKRIEEIENKEVFLDYLGKIKDIQKLKQFSIF